MVGRFVLLLLVASVGAAPTTPPAPPAPLVEQAAILAPVPAAPWAPYSIKSLGDSIFSFIAPSKHAPPAPPAAMVTFATTGNSVSEAPDMRFAVETQQGLVGGHLARENTVVEFLGVRYAAPPIGELRFAKAQAAPKHSGVKLAAKFGAGCAQRCSFIKAFCPSQISEDCLFANVWTPSLPTAYHNPALPVLVHIHGGSFVHGHSGMLNGSRLASQGMVVVTFNYRLGALGFLATKDLKGNFGLSDQRELLHWVKRNIHAFGGNPNRVTLDGFSAGAMSVAAHLVAPGSTGLFHQAILQSAFLGIPYVTHKGYVATTGKAFEEKLEGDEKLTSLERLRAADLETILAVQEKMATPLHDPWSSLSREHTVSLILPFAPVLGEDLEDQPMILIQQQKWNKMPIMAGYTKDEMALFIKLGLPELASWAHRGILYATFGKTADEVIKEYEVPEDADHRTVLQEWSRDLVVACPLRNVSHSFPPNSYLYRFDYKFSDPKVWQELANECSESACHGADLGIAFYGAEGFAVLGAKSTETDRKKSEEVFRMWSRFILHSNPNGGGDRWPGCRFPDASLHVFDSTSSDLQVATLTKCDMWDRLGYFW